MDELQVQLQQEQMVYYKTQVLLWEYMLEGVNKMKAELNPEGLALDMVNDKVDYCREWIEHYNELIGGTNNG